MAVLGPLEKAWLDYLDSPQFDMDSHRAVELPWPRYRDSQQNEVKKAMRLAFFQGFLAFMEKET